MTVKDKQNGTIRTLLITPQKSGNCIIKTDQTNELSYTRQKAAISTIEPDNGFQQFFRKDTACLQGYIDGYDPRLGFETGLVIYQMNSPVKIILLLCKLIKTEVLHASSLFIIR